MKIPDYILNNAREVLQVAGRFDALYEKYAPESHDIDLRRSALRLAFYLSQREKGVNHQIAAMTACQAAPRSMTDRELFEGMGPLAKQFEGEEDYLDRIVAGARAHGHNPGANDVYMSNLARFEGDPLAFVPPTGGRGHIRKVCEDRGLPCEGAVNVKGREPSEDPLAKKIPLANSIVAREMNHRIKKDPGLKEKDPRELREAIIDKHGATT